jgi:hypothetical protein
MQRFLLPALTTLTMLATLAVLTAYAAGMGLKPGLWEVKVDKMLIDGRDISAQMATAAAQRQQMMANMPAEQRARMEAMFKQNGGGQGSNGGFRICISPAMAKRDTPVIDKEGRCRPATVSHNGNQMSYEFSCTINGATTAGKGKATLAPDLIMTQVDMTSTSANGKTRVTHNESEMRYLGADCGDVKPPDAPAHQP